MTQRVLDRMMPWIRQYWQQGTLGVLGVILAWQVISLLGSWLELRQISSLIAETETLSVITPEDDPEANQTPQRENVKNIFKEEQAQYQLTAIYMDKAIINGQQVEVGGRVGKAEVKEIDLFHVVIQEEGKEHSQTLTMFQSGGGGGPGPSMASRRGPSRQRSPGESRGASAGGQTPSRAVEMPQPGQQVNFEQMRARFMNMSPEERAAAREQFRSMRGAGGGFRGQGMGRPSGGGAPPGGGGRGGGGGGRGGAGGGRGQ